MKLKKEHLRFIRTWVINTKNYTNTGKSLEQKIKNLALKCFFTTFKSEPVDKLFDAELNEYEQRYLKEVFIDITEDTKKYNLKERKLAKEYLKFYYNAN